MDYARGLQGILIMEILYSAGLLYFILYLLFIRFSKKHSFGNFSGFILCLLLCLFSTLISSFLLITEVFIENLLIVLFISCLIHPVSFIVSKNMFIKENRKYRLKYILVIVLLIAIANFGMIFMSSYISEKY